MLACPLAALLCASPLATGKLSAASVVCALAAALVFRMVRDMY